MQRRRRPRTPAAAGDGRPAGCCRVARRPAPLALEWPARQCSRATRCWRPCTAWWEARGRGTAAGPGRSSTARWPPFPPRPSRRKRRPRGRPLPGVPEPRPAEPGGGADAAEGPFPPGLRAGSAAPARIRLAAAATRALPAAAAARPAKTSCCARPRPRPRLRGPSSPPAAAAAATGAAELLVGDIVRRVLQHVAAARTCGPRTCGLTSMRWLRSWRPSTGYL